MHHQYIVSSKDYLGDLDRVVNLVKVLVFVNNRVHIEERKINMRGYLSKKIVIEILFIVSLAYLPALLGNYGGVVASFLLVLIFLLRKNLEDSFEIYSNKKLLFIFIAIYSILFLNVFFTALGLYKYLGVDEGYIKNIIKIISLTLTLILLKVFGINIKNFKWSMSRGQIIGTLAIGLIYACIIIPFDGFIFINRFKASCIL